MSQPFHIAGRAIAPDQPCYIIAEAGSNHGGSLPTALALIDAAADAGADAVKFQTFKAERLYAKTAGKSDYLGDQRSIYDIIAAMEMPDDWLPTLAAHAAERGLGFLSTPFHEEAVAILDPFVPVWKVASYELTHHPLLRAVAATGKPVIMSTGAATTAEIADAVAVLDEAGCAGLVLLQCTAAYPAPLAAVNVGALVDLRARFGVLTGLSDHSRDPVVAPMTAAALGAVVIEKHFTLSNRLPGPDNAFAVEPHELARLVRRVRAVEEARGSGLKAQDASEIDPAEEELRAFARRTLFTTRPVAKGEAFSRENVDVLRRGKREDGLAPADLPRVLAGVASRDLAADAVLTDGDVLNKTTPLTLRRAELGDMERVFRWANDPATRAASFTSAEIPWSDHEPWFTSSLARPDRHLFIAELPAAASEAAAAQTVGSPGAVVACGLVRLQVNPDDPQEAEVGINVAPEARGRGVGRKALVALAEAARGLGLTRLLASIRPTNPASIRAFEAVGYERIADGEIGGQPARRYVLGL